MPESRLAKTRRSLPEGYQFGDGSGVRCFNPFCDAEIVGEIVWIGETDGGTFYEVPFHPKCAGGPWPFCEVRRSYSIGWNVIEGDHGVYSGQGDEA